MPRATVGIDLNAPSALYRTTVKDRHVKSVKVELPEGTLSDWIASSKVRRTVGYLLVSIGDLQTERTLIQPLSESILQFLRLLESDDSILAYSIRSVAALRKVWTLNHPAVSYVVFAAHASRDAGTALVMPPGLMNGKRFVT